MWAGKVNFETGGSLVAVEYDSDETVSALRARCAKWLSTDTSDVPAAFGVRVAKVGLRRRRVGVVHHGAPVRHRLASLEAAVEAVAAFLNEISHPRPDGFVAVQMRVFARNGRVALLDLPLSVDVDERALRRLCIEEIPAYRPLFDPTTHHLLLGDRAYPLESIVVHQTHVDSLDDARRHIWATGVGGQVAWAEFLDRFGGQIFWRTTGLATSLHESLAKIPTVGQRSTDWQTTEFPP